MSKKKRDRRDSQLAIEEATGHLEDLKQEAAHFFETASPYEISCELTRRGVTTTHREGIYAVLDMDFQRLDPNKYDELSTRRSDVLLAHFWRRQIEGKGREPSVDDLVFLMVASLHFSLKWSESRLAMSEARLATVKEELSRRDQDPLKT